MRMILCDRHDLVVLSLAHLFEGHGHEVVATADRPEHLPGLVEQHHPDLCLLEVVGEGAAHGDGLGEALASIRACAESTDVVVVTGAPLSSVRALALDSGATAIVAKATSGPELVFQVEHRTSQPHPTRPSRSANHARSDHYFLTHRELQVLESLADGDSTERMAARLGLSQATVRSHVQTLLAKLGVHSRSGAVAAAVRAGLIRRCA